MRVAPVADSRHGGPRGWLQRLAGSGIRVPLPVLDWETLALPAQVAVFDERELNHELYLWLAALAAVFEPTGDWIADNRAATARALQRFAGMRGRHQRLTQALQRHRLLRLGEGNATSVIEGDIEDLGLGGQILGQPLQLAVLVLLEPALHVAGSVGHQRLGPVACLAVQRSLALTLHVDEYREHPEPEPRGLSHAREHDAPPRRPDQKVVGAR